MDSTPIFENRTLVTKDKLRALSRHSWKKPRAWAVLILPILVIVFIEFISPAKSDNSLLTWIILLIMIVLAMIYGTYRFADKTYRTRLQMHEGITPESIIQFTDEEIILTEGKNVGHYTYGTVQSIERFGNNIAVYVAQGSQAILLDVNSFTIGVPENFSEFLYQKMPQKKIKL